MNKSWQVWVDENHGCVGQDGLLQFPDLFGQVAAVRSGNALAVLDGFALIRLEGEDAESFLQGQLSGDIREVGEEARFTTYSTAKGRMLASFLAWQLQGSYYLMVSADICQAIAKRLTMFVMRSKVKVTVLNGADACLLGVRGAQLEAVIAQYHAKPAAGPLAVQEQNGDVAITLPGGGFILNLTPDSPLAAQLVAEKATAVSSQAWGIRDIDAGIAWVTLATQEQFVPQMANMDLIGAVSFKKGCYPGQEIVARTQYLGKVKRRLFKASLQVGARAGDKLFSPELPEQSIGMVAAVCPVNEVQQEALVVVQTVCWEKGIYLEAEYQHRLECLTLPYPIQDE